MIKEAYCSFEVAKLLKKKGFPQEYDIFHSMVYNEEDYEDEYEVQRMVLETRLIKAGTASSYPAGVPEPKCYCPTHQMAMAWLREEHKICIVISPISGKGYTAILCDVSDFDDFNYIGETYYFFHPEEAVEAALKYSLKNLI